MLDSTLNYFVPYFEDSTFTEVNAQFSSNLTFDSLVVERITHYSQTIDSSLTNVEINTFLTNHNAKARADNWNLIDLKIMAINYLDSETNTLDKELTVKILDLFRNIVIGMRDNELNTDDMLFTYNYYYNQILELENEILDSNENNSLDYALKSIAISKHSFEFWINKLDVVDTTPLYKQSPILQGTADDVAKSAAGAVALTDCVGAIAGAACTGGPGAVAGAYAFSTTQGVVVGATLMSGLAYVGQAIGLWS